MGSTSITNCTKHTVEVSAADSLQIFSQFNFETLTSFRSFITDVDFSEFSKRVC